MSPGAGMLPQGGGRKPKGPWLTVSRGVTFFMLFTLVAWGWYVSYQILSTVSRIHQEDAVMPPGLAAAAAAEELERAQSNTAELVSNTSAASMRRLPADAQQPEVVSGMAHPAAPNTSTTREVELLPVRIADGGERGGTAHHNDSDKVHDSNPQRSARSDSAPSGDVAVQDSHVLEHSHRRRRRSSPEDDLDDDVEAATPLKFGADVDVDVSKPLDKLLKEAIDGNCDASGVWNPCYVAEVFPRVAEASKRPISEWMGLAFKKGFKSDYVPRGAITGLRSLENKQMIFKLLEGWTGCAASGLDVVPETHLLPDARHASHESSLAAICLRSWESRIHKWVKKPMRGAFGSGVEIFNLESAFVSAEALPKGEQAEAFATECAAIAASKKDGDFIIQEFLDNPLLISGRKIEVRAHVLVARAEPMLALLDSNFVVKWATKKIANDAKSWIINSHAQALDSLDWDEVEQHLREEFGDAVADHVVEAVYEQISHAVRVVLTAARGRSDKHRGAAWEIYGVDFALSWQGDKIRASLLDWNMRPGIGLKCRCGLKATMPFVKSSYLAIAALAVGDKSFPADMNLTAVIDAAGEFGGPPAIAAKC